jgi:HK97 family phage prohead protease
MEFTGWASIFGNRDHHGHVMMPGAFANTISQRLPQKLIKVFRDHWELVGMPIEIREEDRGLYVHCRLDDTDDGRDTYSQLKSGSLAHMSFGFDVTASHPGEDEDGRDTLYIDEVRLWEVSPVVWPANDQARIEQVKARREARGIPLPSLAAPDLSVTMQHLKSAVEALSARDALTTEEEAIRKDALSTLGGLTRTLSALPRSRSAPGGPGAADATKATSTALLDLTVLEATLNDLRASIRA